MSDSDYEIPTDDYTILTMELEKLQMSNVRLIAELGRIAQALGVEPSMKAVLSKIEELRASKLSIAYRTTDYNYFETAAEAEKYNKLRGDDRTVDTCILYDNRWVNTIDEHDLERSIQTIHKVGEAEALAKEDVLRRLTPGQKELLGITE